MTRPVPYRTLYTGARMPAIGLGTFGSDRVSADEIAAAVRGAAEIGYRHFDCASVYGNEDRIGGALGQAIAGGIPREEFWITSKLWNDKHGERDVIPSCRQSLADLAAGLPGHVPRPLALPQFPPARLRRRLAQPRCEAVHPRKLHEDLAADGKARGSRPGAPHRHLQYDDPQAGTAAARLRASSRRSTKWSCTRISSSPSCSTSSEPTASSLSATHPIGSPARPERDRTAADTVDIEDPVIVEIANRLGIHPAVVCDQVGRPARPDPHSLLHQAQPLHSPTSKASSLRRSPPQTWRASPRIDRNCRLIKGQVFLWKRRIRAGKICGTSTESSPHDRRLPARQQHHRAQRGSRPRTGPRRSAASHEGLHHLRLRYPLHLSRTPRQGPRRLPGRDRRPRARRPDRHAPAPAAGASRWATASSCTTSPAAACATIAAAAT